jgi:inorganic pyrophosphatase
VAIAKQYSPGRDTRDLAEISRVNKTRTVLWQVRTMENDFWLKLDELIATCQWRIDRPKGTAHPRYPSFVYPIDYGYLEDTRSPDGGGIDIWVGSLPDRKVNAIVCTVDRVKRDSEVKLLIGCTAQEMQQILGVHNTGLQAAILIERPTEECS